MKKKKLVIDVLIYLVKGETRTTSRMKKRTRRTTKKRTPQPTELSTMTTLIWTRMMKLARQRGEELHTRLQRTR